MSNRPRKPRFGEMQGASGNLRGWIREHVMLDRVSIAVIAFVLAILLAGYFLTAPGGGTTTSSTSTSTIISISTSTMKTTPTGTTFTTPTGTTFSSPSSSGQPAYSVVVSILAIIGGLVVLKIGDAHIGS